MRLLFLFSGQKRVNQAENSKQKIETQISDVFEELMPPSSA
jgi:uncharacterized protein (UPF0335 family)